MSSQNFVIQDVVRHVRDERMYNRRRHMSSAMRRGMRKVWLYLIVTIISGGVGYAAVYLPDALAEQAQRAQAAAAAQMMSTLGAGNVPAAQLEKFQSMSAEQKQQLMQMKQQMRHSQGGR